MAAARLPWHAFVRSADDAEAVAASRAALPGANLIERRMLAAALRGLDDARERRRGNYAYLAGRLAACEDVAPLFPDPPVEACPWLLPLVVAGGSAGLVKRLRQRGVPAGTWPDLPREVVADVATHRAAIQLRHRLLTLPVRQDMTLAKLDYMADALLTVASG
ncbi:MAG: hypothetical protein FJ318_09860 [SAR202 cluster bacterium]|nr:hypothetical protein [SAR202 cluster bacterium]